MLGTMTESESIKRVLFVCTQNKVRNLTAEHLYPGATRLEVKSLRHGDVCQNQLTKELMNWAEVVFTLTVCRWRSLKRIFCQRKRRADWSFVWECRTFSPIRAMRSW